MSFISILTAQQQDLVARKAKGAQRPSYYNPELAQAAQQAVVGKVDAPSTNAMVQISEDLEAFIILMDPHHKFDLISFIQTSSRQVGKQDDLDLMAEVVGIRATNYQRVLLDTGYIKNFDEARQGILSQVVQLSHPTPDQGTADPAEQMIPEVNTLFAALADNHNALRRSETLETHNRITDANTLLEFSGAGADRKKELLSWVDVLNSY